jgi:cell division protein FtsZ
LDAGGVRGARGILINISGSSNLGLHEVNEACSLIRAAAENDDVQINFGVVLNEDAGDEVKITVIATGFERETLPTIHRRSSAATEPPARAAASAVFEPPAPQMAFPEPEPLPMTPEPAVAPPVPPPTEHEAAPEPAPAQPSFTNGHEPLFDELDVPAIVRRRMVQ